MDYSNHTPSSTLLDTPHENDDATFSVMHFIRTFKRWWVLVLLLAFIGAAGTCGIAYVHSRHQYQSSVQMLLGFTKADAYSVNDIQNNVQLLGTFSHLITSDAVLTPVAQKTHTSINDIRNSVVTSTDSDSLLITVQLTRNSASQTSSMIREISSQSRSYINKHFPQTRVTLLTSKIEVNHPHVNLKRNAVLGLAGGLILGCLLCLILPEKRRNSSHSLHAAVSRYPNR